MMPVVRVSDAAFMDLKLLSKWLETKTPGATIEEIISRSMDDLGLVQGASAEAHVGGELPAAGAPMTFKKTPGLSFTKVLTAKVDGIPVPNPKWGTVLTKTIGAVLKTGLNAEALVRDLQINARSDQYEEHGYKYQPEVGLSIQGQSAPDAWREISRLANKWQIPVEVEFQWRENPKAQHPGRLGVLHAGI